MGFLSWYYPTGILQVGKIFIFALRWEIETFSIFELARTLFSPWRRDIIYAVHPTLQQLFQIFALNLASRFFGLIIRLVTLIAGLLIVVISLIFFILLFAALAFLPLSLPLILVSSALLFFYHPFSPFAYLALLIFIILAHIIFELYQKPYLKNPPLPESLVEAIVKLHRSESINLAPFLDFEAKQIFLKSPNLSELRKRLIESQKARFIFSRAAINPLTLPENHHISATAEQFLLFAGEQAVLEKHQRIEEGDLILALAHFDPTLTHILASQNLDQKDLAQIVYWQTHLWKIYYPVSVFIQPANFQTTGGIAKNWASGYTPVLDEFSSDITEMVVSKKLDYIYLAHRTNTEQIETVLSRSGKHNVILVGPPGIGKQTTVMGLARKILIGKTLPQIAHKRVVRVDLNTALSASSGQEVEQRLIRILSEVSRAGNVILYIEDIERLFENRNLALGAINATQILLPFLNSTRMQLIATTTNQSYNSFIINQPGLSEAFEKIDIKEPNMSQSLRIAEEVAPQIEVKTNTFFLYGALKEIVNQADRLFASRRFPQKAIDLTDEIASFASKNNLKIITPQIVDQYISTKTNVPIAEANAQQKQTLLNLETKLHNNMVNQEQAVKAVADALRRSFAGVASQGKPMGNFLFIGPTGVGKTQLARSLAEVFFGSQKQILRLDMSEFQQTEDIYRLIGEQKANIPGILTARIREKPFTLLLLDEIEKAHPNILNLFLQILDEGQITDTFGEKAYFKNALIIATSNAGSNFIRQELEKNAPMEQISPKLLDYIQNQKIFTPEFLNRFDAIIAFRSLKIEELEQVMEIKIRKLNHQLKNKVMVNLSGQAIKKLAILGQDPEFGARALERVLQDKVENLVANAILNNQVAANQTFVISEKMIK
ncbi:MAG: hypothetical protein CEN89_42 [Candidatus Berkelbacteria bacterium Licking1014_7]|uniref:ATP-dependent Clp protease ATP-binding subunit ClpC n=1 Tax=Candidatus Berkelbacteria bacterium Licking1014_7 TaxID=2017147 RepID=A0A554LKU8_9BACT|nr:MAG: hypothetical protein CEN89_42 [Candidatus Berkelbacteria bacterium Licking1014_7]